MTDLFKKKILHRAKYRGIKELDIIFYKFLLEYEDKITDDELYELEKEYIQLFGNEKNYRHYKDVLKSILYDLYARTKKIKLKNTLKKIYKF